MWDGPTTQKRLSYPWFWWRLATLNMYVVAVGPYFFGLLQVWASYPDSSGPVPLSTWTMMCWSQYVCTQWCVPKYVSVLDSVVQAYLHLSEVDLVQCVYLCWCEVSRAHSCQFECACLWEREEKRSLTTRELQGWCCVSVTKDELQHELLLLFWYWR